MVGHSDEGVAGHGHDEEGFPESCPICSRVNFGAPDDHCEHYWATVYDGEMFGGPYAQEFEALWHTLDSAYQSTDDARAKRLLRELRRDKLKHIAQAMVDSDRLWWLDELEHKNYIEAEASLASGTGWNLYQAKDGWFEATMRDLRKAVAIAVAITS